MKCTTFNDYFVSKSQLVFFSDQTESRYTAYYVHVLLTYFSTLKTEKSFSLIAHTFNFNRSYAIKMTCSI